jgi:protein TonB
MARRRRKKNPLLVRILVVSIAAHAVALPIAAHFGAFAKIEKHFGTSSVVVINTPPLEEKKVPEKAKPKAAKPHAEAKHSSSESHHASATPKSNLNSPKLLAAAPGSSGDTGPSVDANGSGKAGVLPTEKSTGPAPSASGNTNANSGATAPPAHPVVTAPPATHPAPPPPPPPPPVAAKKFVQVETTYAPAPVIPDDLRSQPLDATTVVEADVSPSGQPENIKIVSSSGTKELDDIGLDTAKKYRFKAAQLGDDAVEGHVRFRIIFKVE